ncbi:hypothetical protein AC249_AIPGENE27450, partial [Exaiptasia diaphana]
SSYSSCESAIENLSDTETSELVTLESIEPLATQEQHAEYLEQVEAEEDEEREFNERFTGEVAVESWFLRSVAYRQIVRFIWNYMANTMRIPLASCVYNAIRNKFPSENGNYKGFEEEEEEENRRGKCRR